MRPGEDEFGLRLAAKAAHRAKAARLEWPAFETRLRELGYGPREIAHAFSALSGPGSVAEALAVLRAPIHESHPITLSFEVTETRGGPSLANRVTITSTTTTAISAAISGPPGASTPLTARTRAPTAGLN